MKFKVKVIGTYIIVLTAVIFLSVFTIIKARSSQSSIDFVRNKVSVSVAEMKQVKLDIIQIQQILTDTSVTGYLDGFDDAEEHFINANKLLDNDILRKIDAGKPELAVSLKAIKIQMEAYYDVGKTMAHQYIDNGREAGNVWMDKFDPEAAAISEMIDKQVDGYTKVYELQLKGLSDNQSDIVQMLILISLVSVAIIIIIGIVIYVSLNRGIELISEYSLKLSKNDITDSAKINRKDEFGISAGQFKNSFKILNNLITSIKNSTNTTNGIKDSLSASAEETSATIGNIKNSTSSLLSETTKMNANVTDNVTAIEEITANISSINNQITEQAAMVEESTASITEMISSLESMDSITVKKGEAVDNLVTVAGNGVSTLAEMAEGFRAGVVEKIEGISEMATTIQQISSQTNLLSMNAAIEAAHAGDAGKGFAVVADEIRKLADTSSKSSASITRIIKEISDGVADTEVKTKQSSDAFDVINVEIKETKQAFDEIASSTRELSAGGKQILDAMTILQDVTTNVKGASEEMAIGSEQIVRGQLELKDISDKVAKGMQEISSGSEEIVIASDEIVRYSSELNSVVNDLKDGTDKFKT